MHIEPGYVSTARIAAVHIAATPAVKLCTTLLAG